MKHFIKDLDPDKVLPEKKSEDFSEYDPYPDGQDYLDMGKIIGYNTRSAEDDSIGIEPQVEEIAKNLYRAFQKHMNMGYHWDKESYEYKKLFYDQAQAIANEKKCFKLVRMG